MPEIIQDLYGCLGLPKDTFAIRCNFAELHDPISACAESLTQDLLFLLDRFHVSSENWGRRDNRSA